MTVTIRRSRPRGASRLLSLFSDTALEKVERSAPSGRRRSAAGRSRSAPAGASPSRSTGSSRRGQSTSGDARASSRPTASRGSAPSSSTSRNRASRPPAAGGPASRNTASRSGPAPRRPGPTRTTGPGSTRRPAPTRPAGAGPIRGSGRALAPTGGRAPSRDPRAYPDYGSGRARRPWPDPDELWYDDDIEPGPGPVPARTTSRAGAKPGRTGSRATPAARSGRSSSSRSGRSRIETASGFRSRRSGKGQPGRARRKSHPPVTEVGERTAAYLTATVLGLTLFGLVMVLSASSVSSLHQLADSPFFQFKRQALWAGLGAVAFVVASRIDYRRLRPLAGPLLLLTIVMLAALLVPGLGQRQNGSTRWLGIGPIVIQPSEVAKLVLIVFVADLLARRERRMDRAELTVRPVMLVLVAVSGMIVVQPKLGTPIILGAVTLMMLFVAGARIRSLIPWVSVAALAAGGLAYMADYRRDRLISFLDPWKDPLGIGMQSIQSQVGIASGGLYGVGLGAGRAKWGFLPEAQSDFIFAIVAEEVGLIGASALIGGFLLIAWFGIRTAAAAPDRFGTLLAAGITCWLLVQAFLNIGMVLGVLPITGEALPFVSAGGSSLVVTLASAGLLTSVARRVRG